MHRSASVSSEKQEVKSCHWDGFPVYDVNVFRIMKRCGIANGKNNPQILTQRSFKITIGDWYHISLFTFW